MLYAPYTWEKLRELEREARARLPGGMAAQARPALAAQLRRAAGGLLRRFGAGLQNWGETPSPTAGCCEACG
jgi:hypothetical protein